MTSENLQETLYKKNWTKNCPKCNKLQSYSRIDLFNVAVKTNRMCLSCSLKGRKLKEETKQKLKFINLGKYRTIETKNKISVSLKGKQKSKEHINKVKLALKGRVPTIEERIKNSNSCKGRVSYMKGKHHTEETKYKLRISTINDLKKKGVVLGKYGATNYNPKACEYIDKLNIENGWNLQHALNGGEVELYGYFVDGYDKEKNIIFEYDEHNHNEIYRKNKDIIRQNNLIKKIEPVLFLRYDEQWNKLYTVCIPKTSKKL